MRDTRRDGIRRPLCDHPGTLAANSNYTISFNRGTLTITPAPLSVNANPLTKVYGTSDPSLTDAATGFVDTTVDGVTINDTAATATDGPAHGRPGETVSGGPYAINQGTLAANGNYTIGFTGGTLTITPAPLYRYRQSANQGLWHRAIQS